MRTERPAGVARAVRLTIAVMTQNHTLFEDTFLDTCSDDAGDGMEGLRAVIEILAHDVALAASQRTPDADLISELHTRLAALAEAPAPGLSWLDAERAEDVLGLTAPETHCVRPQRRTALA